MSKRFDTIGFKVSLNCGLEAFMSDESTSPKSSGASKGLVAVFHKRPLIFVAAGAVVLALVVAAVSYFSPAPLSFSEVNWTVDYAEDEITYELSPHLTLTAKVSNTTGKDIGNDKLPSLVCNQDTIRLGFEEGSSVGPNGTASVKIDKDIPISRDGYELKFEQGDKTKFEGLDGVAENIAKELASKVDGINVEKSKREQERKEKPFEFEDVTSKVETLEEGEGSARFVRPKLTVTAKVKNPSTESRKVEDLPVLVHDGKSESFVSSRTLIGPNDKDEVTMTVLFDRDVKPQTFTFSAAKDKPAYKGLDSVAEKIAKEFSDIVSGLPAKQAAIDAKVKEEEERKVREEEERRRQEEERRRREEEECLRSEQEAAERAEAQQQAREEAEQNYLNSQCWVTNTGKKYHTNPNCSGLANANELIPTTVGQAREDGYAPCGKRGCAH